MPLHTPTVLAPRRARHHRRRATAAALIAIGALTPTAGALAQPARDIGSATKPATAVARDHHRRATPGAITYSNPLDRSRGPGAGAGLL